MESVAMPRHPLRSSSAFLLVMILIGSLVLLPSLGIAAAQDSSPDAGSSLLADLGLPTLEVTVTDDGIEMPGELAAGTALLTAHNQTEGFVLVDVVQLPNNASIDDFLAVEDAIPAWAAQAVLAGGVELPPLATASVVISLAAGEYTVIADGDPAIASPSATLVVTGEHDSGVDAIPAAATIDLGAYLFDFPETIAAGPQIWHVTNTHNVLHHALILQTDALYTPEEVLDGLMAAFSGTPAAEGFSFETSVPVLNTPVLSGGQSAWIEIDLAPGTYAAICFVPDPGADTPHAVLGMIETFEVAAD